MSYCRFSCDDYKSDIYAYESIDNEWCIHVAGNRIENVEDIPKLARGVGIANTAAWIESYLTQRKWLDVHERRVPINLPNAGESFYEPTLQKFKERLLTLKEEGFHVPAHVFEVIEEEIEDASKS